MSCSQGTVVGGTVSTTAAGGQNVNLHAAQRLGTDSANLTAGVFAAGNTAHGPVTTGAFAEANANGHGLSIQHSTTPNFGSTMSENARLNVFKNDTQSMDANAFHSRTQLENGLKFDRVGGNAAWNHAAGHSATVGATHIPQFNMTTIDAAAKANMWSSPNRATTLDLTGNASRNLSGPFAGKNNFGANLGFTHRF